MTNRTAIATMLRAGATYSQIKNELHVSGHTIADVRETLRIPLPAGRRGRRRPERQQSRDHAVAAMLRAGATYKEIKEALNVGRPVIAAVRKAQNIPLPPGRAGRRTTPNYDPDPETARRHDRAAQMLRADATYDQVRAEVGLSYSTISRIRKTRRIPPRRGATRAADNYPERHPA
jgi:uncharacterized protein YerC